MKTCVDCQRQLPETAIHCVFCGVKQPASPMHAAPGLGSSEAKTQIAKPLEAVGAPAAAAPPAKAADEPVRPSGFFGGAAARDGTGAAGKAAVPNPARAAPNQPTVAAAPAPRLSNPALSPEQPAPAYAAPAGQPGVAPPSAPTLAAAAAPGQAAPPGAAPPSAPTLAAAAPAAGNLAPAPAMPNAVPVAPVAAEASGPAPRPPYLASETSVRMNAPVEPWAHALKGLMLGVGAFLVVCFAAPWSIAGGVEFSWDRLRDAATTSDQLAPLLIAASGLVAVFLALFPVATIGRGLAAAAIGVIPAVAAALTAPNGGFALVGSSLGLMALVAGLLLRSQYREALLARLVVTGGAAVILLMWIVPQDGTVPIAAALAALGSDLPTAFKLAVMGELLVIAVAVVALIAWMPAPSSASGAALAWAAIAVTPTSTVISLLAVPNTAEQLSADIFATLLLPLAGAAWIALGGWGAATLLGKLLESR